MASFLHVFTDKPQKVSGTGRVYYLESSSPDSSFVVFDLELYYPSDEDFGVFVSARLSFGETLVVSLDNLIGAA
jgi:hypothetical protein